MFAKATYFMGDGDFHFFFGGSLGGGTIRHVAKFPQDTSCGTASAMPQNCVDTLAAGPVLVGPNLGIMYDFSKTRLADRRAPTPSSACPSSRSTWTPTWASA